MALVNYTEQNEYDLVNSGQECIGWTVVDQAGNQLGLVTEMLIDTDRDMVDSILIDRQTRIPAADFALNDGQVIVRGILQGNRLVANDTTPVATAENNNVSPPVPYAANARHVAGVTREANESEITIPIIEEQLNVGKRVVKRGGALIHTHVEEVPVEERVTLREENVQVGRRPADRLVENAPGAFKEGTIEVTEIAEIPVVDKQIRVVEEVVIGKEVTEHEETVRDTVKRREVEVERYESDINNVTNH
jgi:stress response protein YsnF